MLRYVQCKLLIYCITDFNILRFYRYYLVLTISSKKGKVSLNSNVEKIFKDLDKTGKAVSWNMAKSEDISDLSGNLAKMSISAPNTMNQYIFDLRISYTKCCFCCFNIKFSKDAMICSCTRHWYCSPQCSDKYKDFICIQD